MTSPAVRIGTLIAVAVCFCASAQTDDPLTRAVAAVGGEAALRKASRITVVMLGTQDSRAIDQGYFAAKETPLRQQDTLVMDAEGGRAALRTEGLSSDGSPTSWRHVVTREAGWSVKLKTGRVSRLGQVAAAASYRRMRWRVPHLALEEMLSSRDRLRCGDRQRLDGVIYDVCVYSSPEETEVGVLFDVATGLLVGYRYTGRTMTGPQPMQLRFKAYVPTALGLYPAGERFLIGDAVYRDMNYLDVAPLGSAEHEWFTPPPEDAKPASSIPQLPPASVEEVAPGVWFLRNVGGYNAMFARTGDCVALFDAPASLPHAGSPLPAAGPPADLAAIIVQKVREVTGKEVCYVIPTHHHGDHFGGVYGLAAAGAQVITTPGNEALARRMAPGAKIRLVEERMTLGTGADQIDVHVLRGDPHAEEMLFVHLPEKRIVFEGDLSDYVLSARNLARFIETRSLAVDRIYRSHSSGPVSPADLRYEEPAN
jgi:glyoxylase-like metal-dependent hydrolase (beta-lactamase superfamily II)